MALTDLARFHRLLVRTIAAARPNRLRGALSISEIRDTILPYRRHRRALALDSVEDYDALLLRLAAGDEGYAMLDDAALFRLFEQERKSSNPDLLLLQTHGTATLTLAPDRLSSALAQDADDGEAAPQPVVELEAPARPEPAAPVDEVAFTLPAPAALPVHSSTPFCPFCGGTLPGTREVKFCPHCGQQQGLSQCPECRAEVEPGWKHCVSCGSELPAAW